MSDWETIFCLDDIPRLAPRSATGCGACMPELKRLSSQA